MKPTPEDFEPRRDGWYEHKGTWAEVVVGTVMADPNFRSKRWEVIAVQMGRQIDFNTTLWTRVREQVSGVEATIPPRQKSTVITILTQNPLDTRTGEPTWPTDSDAVLLLVQELGATVLATRDERTGEITCPDYTYKSHIPRERGEPSTVRRGLVEHMRFAHQMSVDDDLDLVEAITLHGKAHNLSQEIGKGGFPHRHVPEQAAENFGR